MINYQVNYEYIETHTRREFIQLLRPYDIKVGEAFTIWKELNQSKSKSIQVQICRQGNSDRDNLFHQMIENLSDAMVEASKAMKIMIN